MRKQKHTIYSFGLLLVSILCLVGGITAYAAMTMKEEKVNFFQIGNLQTKIDEVFTEPTTIAPEKAVEKSQYCQYRNAQPVCPCVITS
ncbi:hypothetical protein GQR36_12200 [Enterococcus termitis]